MLTLESPVTGSHLIRPKTGRRPLQPITSSTNVPPIDNKNEKFRWIHIQEDSNKENPNQSKKPHVTSDQGQNRSPISNNASSRVPIEQFEVSLADELTAIREKMERLRWDKEKTEKMLRERGLLMDVKMKEINERGEIQKVLEIEVDRLYRLNQLRSLCNRILPIKSLRDKEQEKIKPDTSRAIN